ncbi:MULTISPECIES: helix-turn-helix domain-containing protein [unclassified Vibrio]|uniref:helix-turn-helix domain-containing protein n=2 Tax=Vibrio TaxID=662 RepID=UPI001A8C574B|nr:MULTISPECIES: helix-turn-helix domain-containing protein [unclassified Vibrio]MBO0244968.1 hypothetical protein [Vibrio sp. Vb0592]MDW1735458.1 hypothetical protein [Vibrio sp. Vb2235]MDW1787730.1 hypothetical protein [Vibrio sp. Vb2227]MDW1817325.1 hypothetical protein [Vibrio sp. Vb2232]MDW1866904.1 hypothetical protein [Vibrio sp. Vb1127]
MEFILYHHIPKLDAESKMLLILMFKDAENHKKYNKPLLDMVRDYGVSKPQILKSLFQLKELGIIEHASTSTEPRKPGRPVSSYKINLELFPLWNKTLKWNFEPFVEARLQSLCLTNSRRVKLANRLLLILLASKADQAGTVDSVSFSELSYWMGCTMNRIQSIVKKLRQEGLLSYYIPGISHQLIGKHRAVYFLDLRSLGKTQIKIVLRMDLPRTNTIVSLMDFSGRGYDFQNKVLRGGSLEGFVYYWLNKQQVTSNMTLQIDYLVEKHFVGLLNKGKLSISSTIEFYRRYIALGFTNVKVNDKYKAEMIELLSHRAKKICDEIFYMQSVRPELKRCHLSLRYNSSNDKALLFTD